jgi:hypothetical protein
LGKKAESERAKLTISSRRNARRLLSFKLFHHYGWTGKEPKLVIEYNASVLYIISDSIDSNCVKFATLREVVLGDLVVGVIAI